MEILSTEAARLLASIGMMGLSRNEPEAAQSIFAALSQARPEQEIGPIGEGLTQMARGNPRGAVAVLSAAPQTEGVSLFLALAYQALGDAGEARDILENLVNAGNATIGRLAADMISESADARA